MNKLDKTPRGIVIIVVLAVAMSLIIGTAVLAASLTTLAEEDQTYSKELADLKNMTGLMPSTLQKVYEKSEDWHAIVRQAPIYLAISDRMEPLGDEKLFVQEAIEQGYDPVSILNTLDYLMLKSIPLSELKGILEQRARGVSWDKTLDPARNKYGIAEANPLTKDEIRQYLAQGLTPEDITESVGLAEAAGRESRSLLAERIAGKNWDELQAAYDPRGIWKAQKNAYGQEEQKLLQKGYQLTDIRAAQLYARALGADPEPILQQVTPDLPVDQVILNSAFKAKTENDNKKVEQLKNTYGIDQQTIELWRKQGLNPNEIENVLRLSKEYGFDANTIISLKNSGKGWKEIIEIVAQGGEGAR